MIFKKVFSDLNLEKKDLIFLSILLILTIAIVINKINFHSIFGFNSDVPVYLSNALYYAGINYNLLSPNWLNNAPALSFLTSIFFRFGYVTPEALYIVNGIFEIFGIVGLYIFFKNRFNPLYSLLGCIFFESTYLYLQCASSGLTDTSAVSLSVWALVFAIVAFNKNPKYFILSSIIFTVGMFIRPTVGFVLPIIFLYFVYKHDLIKLFEDLFYDRTKFKDKISAYLRTDEFKYILISVLVCIGLYCIIILGNSLIFNVHFDFFDKVDSSMSGFSSRKGLDLGYHPNKDYYTAKLFEFISNKKISMFGVNLSYILFSIIIIGLAIKIIDAVRNFKEYEKLRNKTYYRNPKMNLILIASILILLGISVMGSSINHFIPTISLVLIFMIIISMIKQYDIDLNNHLFFIVNVSWMMIYFVFINYIDIKVYRYFLPILVPIAYLFALSLESIVFTIYKFIKNENKHLKDFILKIVPILFIILLLSSIYITLDTYDVKENYHNYFKIYDDTKHTSKYLMKLDKNYMEKNITTDHRDRFYNWFLKRGTNSIDNLYEPLHLFDESKSDYLLLNESVDFENYTEIYHHGRSHLYVNNNNLK